MSRRYSELTFTEGVKKVQRRHGSRAHFERAGSLPADDARMGEREKEFIAARDSFYMASVNENDWPYVQFRGGPPGFLKVLDDRTLAYADFRGNLQYISVGNFEKNNRVALILIDYPARRRLKIMARAEVLDAGGQPDLIGRLHDPAYPAKVERAIVLHVAAFDWNCHQHITPRYTAEEWQARSGPDER